MLLRMVIKMRYTLIIMCCLLLSSCQVDTSKAIWMCGRVCTSQGTAMDYYSIDRGCKCFIHREYELINMEVDETDSGTEL